jgi:AraC-like DNA-binding protein
VAAIAESDSGSARISAVWHLPEVLAEFGIDLVELLETAGVRTDLFDDRENRIAYADFARLLLACERLSGCDHIVLLIAQRARLADFGLPAQAALCGDTVGQALRTLAGNFTLHNSAAILSVITSGDFARLAYAIVAPDMPDTRPFQLGAMTAALGILRGLCGPAFQTTVVTFASRGPADLRPLHRFFRAPLRFDSEESALVFERHWLDRPLTPVDPRLRRQVEAEVQAQRALLMADFPAAVRRVVRKQLLAGHCSMDQVAGLLGMHRRTLDRHLQRHGTSYGDLVEAVKSEAARQLLRDTGIQIQQVAESLHFSSAANFATAFRRWTGDTPSEFRRRAG